MAIEVAAKDRAPRLTTPRSGGGGSFSGRRKGNRLRRLVEELNGGVAQRTLGVRLVRKPNDSMNLTPAQL